MSYLRLAGGLVSNKILCQSPVIEQYSSVKAKTLCQSQFFYVLLNKERYNIYCSFNESVANYTDQGSSSNYSDD
jgi:hypothetical protein